MKKGSHHTKQSKNKIKIARAKQGSNVWNKGLKGYGKYKGIQPCKILRQDKNYYLKELERNAKRAIKLGYHDTPKRRKEIYNLIKEKQIKTGAGSSPKNWNNKEVEYLKDNYLKIDALTIALELKRSWSSIMHKVSRLKLRKYNKWN